MPVAHEDQHDPDHQDQNRQPNAGEQQERARRLRGLRRGRHRRINVTRTDEARSVVSEDGGSVAYESTRATEDVADAVPGPSDSYSAVPPANPGRGNSFG